MATASRRSLGAAAALAFLVMTASACSFPRSADHPPEPVPTPTETVGFGTTDAGPAPFIVRYGDTELRLAPNVWSLDGASDASVVDDPPSVGDAEVVYVYAPVTGWSSVSAIQFTGADQFSCDGMSFDPVIEDLGGGWAAIHPRGPSAEYTLELYSGSGPGTGMFAPTGEMHAQLRWEVVDGEPVPPATAAVSLVADNNGTLEAWDLSVEVMNLDPPTSDVSAQVTVTSAEGNSLVLRPEPTGLCGGQSAYLNLPFTETQGVLELGGPPFRYDVALVIDGVTYEGTAQYTTGGNTVPLEFTTPLP